MMVVEFGANLAINIEGVASSSTSPDSTDANPLASRPIDINRPDESIQLMDYNENSVPFDQATEEERHMRIAKVVEKLESLAAKISNAQTPVGEGSSADVDESSSSAFSYNPISIFNNIRELFPVRSTDDSASSTT